MARDRRARGFTLLEAIVALAILAAAGMALFAAMSQSLQMVQRAEAARDADAALRNAVAWMEQINPMEQPSGEQAIGGGGSLHWRSDLVEPPRDGETGYLQPGLYQLGLYDMTLTLVSDDEVRHEARLRRAGYVQVREPFEL